MFLSTTFDTKHSKKTIELFDLVFCMSSYYVHTQLSVSEIFFLFNIYIYIYIYIYIW